MSRTQLGNQGSSRLRRVLGLSISGAALVGLVYFEGVSARAEEGDAQEAGALADEELEELALEEDEAEAEAAEIAVPEQAAPVPVAPSAAAEPAAAEPAAAEPAAAEPAAAEPVVVAMADVGAVEAAAEMPADPPEATMVAVPDLEGMRLRKARRELKAVGLKLSVRDEWGDKIDRDFWGYYRVRSQKIDAGTEVELGSWVRIKARERYQASQGY